MHEGEIIKQLVETLGEVGLFIALIVLQVCTCIKKMYSNKTSIIRQNVPHRANRYYNRVVQKGKTYTTVSF